MTIWDVWGRTNFEQGEEIGKTVGKTNGRNRRIKGGIGGGEETTKVRVR